MKIIEMKNISEITLIMPLVMFSFNHFSGQPNGIMNFDKLCRETIISLEENLQLVTPISRDEVDEAIFDRPS